MIKSPKLRLITAPYYLCSSCCNRRHKYFKLSYPFSTESLLEKHYRQFSKNSYASKEGLTREIQWVWLRGVHTCLLIGWFFLSNSWRSNQAADGNENTSPLSRAISGYFLLSINSTCNEILYMSPPCRAFRKISCFIKLSKERDKTIINLTYHHRYSIALLFFTSTWSWYNKTRI